MELQGRCTRRSTRNRPSIYKDLVTVLPLARFFGEDFYSFFENIYKNFLAKFWYFFKIILLRETFKELLEVSS
uniref:Uncharacterized protein n=1 Tax=Amphiprion percula TaxID=161767 RepID=A0A3P8TVN7_AMPPE